MRGLQLSHALVDAEWLTFDRIFMLTDADGAFVTARQYPQMLLFTTVMLPSGLHLTTHDWQNRPVRFTDFSAPVQPVEVWWNHFVTYSAPETINIWLSDYLEQSVTTIRWTDEHSHKHVKRFPTVVPLSFAGSYPYFLISEASSLDLRRRNPTGITLTQFQPNLVVTSTKAYAEDICNHLRIDEVEFEVVKSRSRYVLTTVNVEQDHKHSRGEPLRISTTDIVRIGDNVEILSASKPRRYRAASPANAATPPPLTTDASVTIVYQGRRFIGNQRDILLEQLELQGIRIPYSCRAGICGTCKVKLLSGDVAPLTGGAAASAPWILSCGCLPRGDVYLE